MGHDELKRTLSFRLFSFFNANCISSEIVMMMMLCGLTALTPITISISLLFLFLGLILRSGPNWARFTPQLALSGLGRLMPVAQPISPLITMVDLGVSKLIGSWTCEVQTSFVRLLFVVYLCDFDSILKISHLTYIRHSQI